MTFDCHCRDSAFTHKTADEESMTEIGKCYESETIDSRLLPALKTVFGKMIHLGGRAVEVPFV